MPTGAIPTIPKLQFSANGVPLVGGTLETYLAGTTTAAETWQDQNLSTSNGTSITLDARGECLVWLDPAKSYKFILKNAVGATLWTVDNIKGSQAASLSGLLSASSGSSLVGHISNATGAVATTVQAKLRELELTPQDFGAVGNGVADDTDAFDDFAAATARKKRMPAGTYKLTRKIAFQPNDFIEGDGDATVLDFSSASLTTGDACVSIAGTITNLGAILSATANAGAVTFSVTSATGLAVGDVLCFYDSTDSSWSGHRTEYRAGEFVQIGRISGTTIYTTAPLYDTYATTVELYKLGGTGGRLANMKIKTPAAQVLAWQIDASVDVSVDNVHTPYGTTYTGGEFKRCYGVYYEGSAFQSTPSVDDEYGVIVSNSQNGNLYASATGGRHPFAFGGGDYACCVPCRNFNVYGNLYGNLGPTGSGDLHGNTEDIKFFGISFANGSDVGGANHKFVGCRFRGNTNSGVALYAGEPVKGTFQFDGCDFETYVDPNTSNFGVVNLGNIDADVKGVFRYVFNSPTFSAPSSTLYLVKVEITAGSYAPDIIINNPTIVSGTGVTQLLRLERSGGAATISNITIGPDVTGLPSGASYVYDAGAGLTVTNYRLPVQSGTKDVAVANAASSYASTVTFRHPYPVTPIVTATLANVTYGGDRALAAAASASTSGFSATVGTCDGANFASSETAVVRWNARMAD